MHFADDGLVIHQRSEFNGLLDIENPATLYYAVLGALFLLLFLLHRLINARFGRVIFGAMHNDERMQALGFDTYRYKLACYVLSGTICGVAGFFLGNFTNFISPEMMDWTRSAELIFMLVISGHRRPVRPGHRHRRIPVVSGISVRNYAILAPDFRPAADHAGAIVRQKRTTRPPHRPRPEAGNSVRNVGLRCL